MRHPLHAYLIICARQLIWVHAHKLRSSRPRASVHRAPRPKSLTRMCVRPKRAAVSCMHAQPHERVSRHACARARVRRARARVRRARARVRRGGARACRLPGAGGGGRVRVARRARAAAAPRAARHRRALARAGACVSAVCGRAPPQARRAAFVRLSALRRDGGAANSLRCAPCNAGL
eukprot:6025920-Pleurochrysis_carterae.AAC.1